MNEKLYNILHNLAALYVLAEDTSNRSQNDSYPVNDINIPRIQEIDLKMTPILLMI